MRAVGMYCYLRRRSWSWSTAILLSIAASAVATPASAQSTPRNVRIVASGSGGGVPSVRVSPDTAQLAPGDVVRFSSVVSGASGNVVWTATGGAITADGSYTAG